MLMTFPHVIAGVLRARAGKLDHDRCLLSTASDLIHSAFARVDLPTLLPRSTRQAPFGASYFWILAKMKGISVSEYYQLLSKALPSGFGPSRWVADETIPDNERVLKKGAEAGFSVIENVHDAAGIFGDLLAQREYGDLHSAVLVSTQLDTPNGTVFEMQPGAPSPGGGHYLQEPMHFAVLVKDEER
jgi:hypothetical protein